MMKTSEEWRVSPEFCGLILLDIEGWDTDDIEHSYYQEKINRGEFIERVKSSTVLPGTFSNENNSREIYRKAG